MVKNSAKGLVRFWLKVLLLNFKMTTGKAFWGHAFWVVMHYIAFNIANKTDYHVLIDCFAKLIPCKQCKQHFLKNLEKYPLRNYTHSNDSLFYHSYVLHDLVNKIKIPPVTSPSFESIKLSYQRMKFADYEKNMWHTLFVIAALLKDVDAQYLKMLLVFFVNNIQEGKVNYEEFLLKYSPDVYLRNNKDAFFYIYLFYSHIYKKKGITVYKYLQVKTSYFAGVGEDCKDCKI